MEPYPSEGCNPKRQLAIYDDSTLREPAFTTVALGVLASNRMAMSLAAYRQLQGPGVASGIVALFQQQCRPGEQISINSVINCVPVLTGGIVKMKVMQYRTVYAFSLEQ